MPKVVSVKFVPPKIGPFSWRVPKKTTMKYGYYFDSVMELPFAVTKERHVRVWLPDSYDFQGGEKRYPVVYFADGQNLVDRHLSAYGDWHLDKVIHALAKEGYEEPILVGIDCPINPKERSNELNPPYKVRYRRARKEVSNPYGDKYVNYVADELKPLIDSLFRTLPGKETTAIAGSSMGGIMAFWGFLSRPEIFGCGLSFSPPFFFYSKRDLKRICRENGLNSAKNGKLFLYVGGKDFEAVFTKKVIWMYEYIASSGFGSKSVSFALDRNEIHHEEAWYKYSYPAFRFFLPKREEE